MPPWRVHATSRWLPTGSWWTRGRVGLAGMALVLVTALALILGTGQSAGPAPTGSAPAGSAPAGVDERLSERSGVPRDGTLPVPRASGALAPADAAPPPPGGLAAQLRPVLTQGPLARDVAAAVVDAHTGHVVWGYRPHVAQVPASTVKLLTAGAALELLGPQHRLVTRTVLDHHGRVVLVGGGDPTLTAGPSLPGAPHTSLRVLARRTARVLGADAAGPVRVAVDGSLFAGPPINPDWEPDYITSGVVSPVTALRLQSSGSQAAPARNAGEVFAGLLRAEGLRVTGPVIPTRLTGAARPLASVRSAPLARLVSSALTTSDNDAAEALLRLVGAASGGRGTVTSGTAQVRAVLTELGVPTAGLRLRDGSGLARSNRVSPATLTNLLAAAAGRGHPRLRALVGGLPVAGLTGTLADRLTGPAAGVVRAKTGTLRGVHALAGLVVDADGALLAFAVLADRVPVPATLAARDRLDLVASRLAVCGCR